MRQIVVSLLLSIIGIVCILILATYLVALSWQKQFDDYSKEPYGFIDTTGKFCLGFNTPDTSNSPYQYEGPFSDCLCLVRNYENQAHNYLNRQGSYLLEPTVLYEARDFSDGMAAIKTTTNSEQATSAQRRDIGLLEHAENWIFIDTLGRKSINGEYFEVGQFADGLCPVRENDLSSWHYINRKGKSAFKGEFDDADSFSSKRAAAKARGGLWGVIDPEGNWVVAPSYKKAPMISSDGWIVCQDEASRTFSYLDKNGKSCLKLIRTPGDSKLHTPKPIENDFQMNQSSGRNTTPPSTLLPSEGLVVMEQGNKYGYCDLAGQTKIPAQFDYCRPFYNGRAVVFDDRKRLFAYIDTSGTLITPYKFRQAYDFSEGSALVQETDQTRLYFIDLTGKNKFGKTFMDAAPFHDGYAYVGKPMIPW